MEHSKLAASFYAGKTLRALAEETHEPLSLIRTKLAAELGKDEYARQAHANGGNAVARKLCDPEYRENYVEKMKRNVSREINRRMKNPVFRENWLQKARAGSKQGTANLLAQLVIPSVKQKWREKCSIGGTSCASHRRGMFAAGRARRRAWSLEGLRRTGKKVLGPHGEHMYNRLERETALALEAAGIKYQYERIIHAPNKNGFFSIDFYLDELNCFVEATNWDDAAEKSTELNKKFEFLSARFPSAKLVLVTTKEDAAEYARFLRRPIYILTPALLPCLAGKPSKLLASEVIPIASGP